MQAAASKTVVDLWLDKLWASIAGLSRSTTNYDTEARNPP